MFIVNAIKVFFLFLTECIFDVATLIYKLIIEIANSDVITQGIIGSFAQRVYVLLGVFMLFKVSFSLINYIVNPDDFTDKQKGIGKLVPNVMITLVLIVLTPRIFVELMDIQHLVINEDLLGGVIFGGQTSETSREDASEKMVFNVFNAFYYYEEGNIPEEMPNNYLNCQDGICRYSEYSYAFDSDYTAYDGIWDDKASYQALLSVAAAVVLALVLIQFCFDIAVRTIKFAFLQLIAPIPIVSRIDPKSSKDGMFSKWFKLCYKTYLNLFVRIAALYFAIAIIQRVMEATITTNVDGFFVKAFLIMGTLLFAKQVPKLVTGLFGLDLDGGFTLNPMKRFKEVPGSNIATAAAAAGVGAIAGFNANAYAGLKSGNGILKSVGSGIAGGTSSFFRTGYSGMKDNKLKPFKAIGAGVKGSVAARNLRDERQIAGDAGIKGVVRRAGVAVNNFAGIPSGADRYEKELSAYDSYLSKQGAIDKLIEDEIVKGKSSRDTTFEWTDSTGFKQTSHGNVNVLRQDIERLKNSGTATAEQIQDAEYRYKAALKQAKIDYVNDSFNVNQDGELLDAFGNLRTDSMDKNIATQIRHMIEEMDYFATQNSSYADLNGKNLQSAKSKRGGIGKAWDSAKGEMHGAKDRVTSSEEYKQAMVNKTLDQKK